MPNIECLAQIDETKIIINRLKDKDITIDIVGDVDFTGVVSILSEHIDKCSTVSLTVQGEDTLEDEKQKLIVSTLNDIFSKYNEATASADGDAEPTGE